MVGRREGGKEAEGVWINHLVTQKKKKKKNKVPGKKESYSGGGDRHVLPLFSPGEQSKKTEGGRVKIGKRKQKKVTTRGEQWGASICG